MSFEVKTPVFDGPLDLLLQLIEERKLHISEISLAKVADDFIAYVEKFEKLPLSESAEFIGIAATLLLIKSKALLPELELSEEERIDMRDLERRLAAYQKVKALTPFLRSRFGTASLFFGSQMREPIFSPHPAINLVGLITSLKRALALVPVPALLKEAVVRKVLSLEEQIKRLSERIRRTVTMKFSDFAPIRGSEKTLVIVSFLALLELVKRGVVVAKQVVLGGEIEIESEVINVPTYRSYE